MTSAPRPARCSHAGAVGTAVVALARRLVGILYALLRDGSVFQPQHGRPPRPTATARVTA